MVDKIGKDSDTAKELLNGLQMSNKGLHGSNQIKKKIQQSFNPSSATVVLVMHEPMKPC